jgi:hypothetical protein
MTLGGRVQVARGDGKKPRLNRDVKRVGFAGLA